MAGVYPGWNGDPTVLALREHLDAQRYLEPLVGRLHQPERRADNEPKARYLQWKAAYMGFGDTDPHLGDRRLPAA